VRSVVTIVWPGAPLRPTGPSCWPSHPRSPTATSGACSTQSVSARGSAPRTESTAIRGAWPGRVLNALSYAMAPGERSLHLRSVFWLIDPSRDVSEESFVRLDVPNPSPFLVTNLSPATTDELPTSRRRKMMRMPSFTAEVSLLRASQHYRSSGSPGSAPSGNTVESQLMSDCYVDLSGDLICPGDILRCNICKYHCLHTPSDLARACNAWCVGSHNKAACVKECKADKTTRTAACEESCPFC